MAAEEFLSLSKLQELIKGSLDDAFPMPLWVVAEVSELKVNYSGHCYLEMVEKGGRNQIPKARANAVIWRSTYGAIDSYFRSVTGGSLETGMKVLVRVSVIYHELYGLSLQISDIDPRYTLGDMQQQRQKTIAQLQDDGVFDMNRELGLPQLIQSVAIVSSRNAAGYQDFINELLSSEFRFEVELFDAFMQGSGSEDSIIAALEGVLERSECFDAVVIIRGGGSQSDLGSFDSYRLCSHIAQFPLPVITGIGHDKDQSIADMVAALSLKTPTAVAGYLVDGLASVDDMLEQLSGQVTGFVIGDLEHRDRQLRDLLYEVSSSTTAMTRSVELTLQRLAGDMQRVVEASIVKRANALDMMRHRLGQSAANVLEHSASTLDTARKVVEGRMPDRILSMGFAIVRSGGRAVKSSRGLEEGACVEITFAEGSAEAQITQVNKNKKQI